MSNRYPTDDAACDVRGWCSVEAPVCQCGHAWDYSITYSDGTTHYTSAAVRDRFHALYGAANPPFVPVPNRVISR